MVGVLASSAVDRGFKILSGQTKDYTIGMCCSPLGTQHSGERTKTGWLGIRIMCPNGATCLPVDCSLSELVLYKSNPACSSRAKRTSSSFH